MQSHLRSNRPSAKPLAVVLAGLCLSAVCLPVRLQALSSDWQLHIRQLVERQELTQALAIAEDQLSKRPEDLEARGWRARLLAWTNRWNESEIEYRTVLQSAPHDTDILVGLADLSIWQGRPAEAIVLLDQASVLDAGRNDVQLRRGRVLHALGRCAEAGAAYARVLSLSGLSVGSEDGSVLLETEPFDKAYGSHSSSVLSLGGPAESPGDSWLQGFRQGSGNEFYRQFGRMSTRSEPPDSSRSALGFRVAGRQSINGLNYAVRF